MTYKPNSIQGFNWRKSASKPDHEIGVEVDCDGSPDCCAAIHIRKNTYGFSWMEVHLTPAEVKWVRKMLKNALKKYRRERRP